MMLMRQPVISDARRTFWPPRPIAIARFSSSTTTSIAWRSSSTTIDCTFAGASAPMTNCAGSSDQSTMSTRSPASSLVTALTREPRTPTQVPIGSTRRSCETHGDLGARAGVAGARLDLEQALLDLGHFLREQLHHEAGRRARQQDLRPAQGRVDLGDVGADAVAGAQVLLRDHLRAAQPPLDRGPTRR